MFTCDPRQCGTVRFGLDRRSLCRPVLRGRSGSPAAGSPQQGVPAGLGQLLDELLFNILRLDPGLLVSSEGQE